MSKIFCFAVCVFAAFTISLSAADAPGASGVTSKRDVVYGKAGDVNLVLDIAIPKGNGPFPAIVCIHGGAWKSGSKAAYTNYIQELAKEGFVAASVMYRFCPQFTFPSQVEDCKCAVRYLRAHAGEYKIDSKRIGALGDSAGGHLSLLLGLMNPSDGCEGSSGCEKESSKVQAVVNYYGPTDFTVESLNPLGMVLVEDFLGTRDRKAPAVAKSSPVTYIDKSDPPVLTFHGSLDPLVPIDQASRLHKALKEKGVTEKLEIIQNGVHGFTPEQRAKTSKMALEFFNKYLKQAK